LPVGHIGADLFLPGAPKSMIDTFDKPDGNLTLKIRPRLPKHWKRLAFKFFHRGKLQEVDIEA
jgi:hypothetical protein